MGISDKVGLYCRKIECAARFIPKDDSRKALAAAATLRNKHELDLHQYRHKPIDLVIRAFKTRRADRAATTLSADVFAQRITEAILRHGRDVGKRPV